MTIRETNSTQKPRGFRYLNYPLRGIGQAVKPGQLTWWGATLGVFATFVLFMTLMGTAIQTIAGPVPTLLLMFSIGSLFAILVGLVAVLLRTIVNLTPPLFFGAVIGACIGFLFVFSQLQFPADAVYLLIIAVVAVEALLGAASAVIFSGSLRKLSRFRQGIVMTGLVISVALNAIGINWLANPGTIPINEKMSGVSGVPALEAPNPSLMGSYRVKTLFYGSGNDLRRPEYGASVSLKTNPVDGELFLEQWRGWQKSARENYWGFDTRHLPLNGRVWYPVGEGPFPLVLVVHGNHIMEEYSDPGYAYLGELLASRGFIVASVDQNFLNTSFQTLGTLNGELDARGWLLLQHLKAWHGWNATKGNPFYKKVDLQNIALIGHSRGGQAVVVAELFNRLSRYPDNANVTFDFNFNIKTLIAIAPPERYAPANKPLILKNINYLVLGGGYDGDLGAYYGIQQYNRVKFTDTQYWIKASIYIDGANHGQFNTVWGRADRPGPLKWLLNLAPILDGEAQRQAAKVYISAFLEATLQARKEYLPLFSDYRVGTSWLPSTTYRTQVEDSQFRAISNYDEDVDVAQGTIKGVTLAGQNLSVWREGAIPIRSATQATNAVYLSWENVSNPDKMASYTITLPDTLARQWQLDQQSQLIFSLANADLVPPLSMGDSVQKQSDRQYLPLDFTIELVTLSGLSVKLPLSQFAPVPRPVESRITKWDALTQAKYGGTTEPILQTFELPLSKFVKANPAFTPTNLKTVRFLFDRVRVGSVILDRVGFRSGF